MLCSQRTLVVIAILMGAYLGAYLGDGLHLLWERFSKDGATFLGALIGMALLVGCFFWIRAMWHIFEGVSVASFYPDFQLLSDVAVAVVALSLPFGFLSAPIVLYGWYPWLCGGPFMAVWLFSFIPVLFLGLGIILDVVNAVWSKTRKDENEYMEEEHKTVVPFRRPPNDAA
jgi:hypothetical protein